MEDQHPLKALARTTPSRESIVVVCYSLSFVFVRRVLLSEILSQRLFYIK